MLKSLFIFYPFRHRQLVLKESGQHTTNCPMSLVFSLGCSVPLAARGPLRPWRLRPCMAQPKSRRALDGASIFLVWLRQISQLFGLSGEAMGDHATDGLYGPGVGRSAIACDALSQRGPRRPPQTGHGWTHSRRPRSASPYFNIMFQTYRGGRKRKRRPPFFPAAPGTLAGSSGGFYRQKWKTCDSVESFPIPTGVSIFVLPAPEQQSHAFMQRFRQRRVSVNGSAQLFRAHMRLDRDHAFGDKFGGALTDYVDSQDAT